jgi:hypothetical protein
MDRRALLRGLALGSAALGLPALAALTARADEAAPPPKRLVLFHFGNGVPMKDWTPATAGSGWQPTPILEALGDSLSRVDVVTGLSTRGTHEGLTGNVHGMRLLAATTTVPGATAPGSNEVTGAGAASVDQLLAQRVGAATAHASLVVAAATRNDSVLEGRLSWSGPNGPIAPIVDPLELHGLLFAGFVPGEDAAAAEVARRRRIVLEYVAASIESSEHGLGAADRARLGEHLTSVREVDKSLDAAGIACVPPAAPEQVGMGAADIEPRSEALLRLSTAALSCDLTRVLSFSLGPTGAGPVYQFLGLGQTDHDISHLDYIHDAAAHDAYLTMTKWKLGRFARLLELLASTPEGDGTLLDSCVVIGFSEMSDGNAHSADYLPVLVAGAGVGEGRHLVYPCTSDGVMNAVMGSGAYCSAATPTPLARLWLTALRACGADIAELGQAGGESLPDLWI